jgi:uncharacterized protein YijF (DUF1287 family)
MREWSYTRTYLPRNEKRRLLMPSKDDAKQSGGDVKRINRGYMLREDLIKALKKLAVDTDKKLYEVMEAAIEEYLERHKTKS